MPIPPFMFESPLKVRPFSASEQPRRPTLRLEYKEVLKQSEGEMMRSGRLIESHQ